MRHLLIASTRALERPCSIGATMPAREAVIILASLTNQTRLRRRAHTIAQTNPIASSVGIRSYLLEPLLEQVRGIARPVALLGR